MFGSIRKENDLGIDWGAFYKTVIGLVVPMALQNLINVGVTAADVVMLGAVGETALSGASLAGQVQYIMTLFLFGLTSGATVLTAQYWGKGDRVTIEKILGMTVKAADSCDSSVYSGSACVAGASDEDFHFRSGCDRRRSKVSAHCCVYLYHDRSDAGISLCDAQRGACGSGDSGVSLLSALQHRDELHLYLRPVRTAGNGRFRRGAGHSVRAYT